MQATFRFHLIRDTEEFSLNFQRASNPRKAWDCRKYFPHFFQAREIQAADKMLFFEELNWPIQCPFP